MANISLEYVSSPAGWESAILTITRPEQLNALNLATIDELDKALDELGAKKNLRALIVTGSGTKAFVAGADVKELETLDPDGAYKLSLNGSHVFAKFSALPFPVIAAVNGFALGGGCELALACDIRLAAENATFALPEVTLGICPGWGGTQRLARLIGTGLAAELMFSAKRIDAAKALEIGLINSIHPADSLMEAAADLVSKIGRNAPIAVHAAKKAMNDGVETALSEGLEIEAREFSALFNTTDAKMGLNAFTNQKKYEYTGE
ncbi:MAG: enoyl-CoA hydratase-related protein [Defluviitaleaceae bacterium]|nr:enoyl-CoA hydratase-related protein [Defluviitaleaceae bacterium]